MVEIGVAMLDIDTIVGHDEGSLRDGNVPLYCDENMEKIGMRLRRLGLFVKKKGF